jgi:hypothetical protein
MFQVVEWHYELNMCLLAVPKYDMCEVEKAMIPGVESPCEIIFCIANTQKSDLDEVEEAMFQVVEWA